MMYKGTMYNVQRLLIAGAVIICLFCSCAKKQVAIERPPFCADSAYSYIEKQLSFGPRVPNSDAHTRCVVWLVEQLRACGAEVELQKGFMPDYRGNNQQIYNIIGHFSTPETATRPRILLGAHYDTRPWCDEEPEYSDRFYNVPGANDGASGVAVLLEVARQLGIRQKCLNDSINDQMVNGKMVNVPVDIIFFDVEDMGTPRVYVGPEREDTWCLGSQLWAADYAQKWQNGKINDQMVNDQMVNAQYQFGIVLDMVGAPDASFPKEMYSTQYAKNYQEQIWRTAEKLGYGALFNNQQSYPITDDHYYVNRIAGIPCVDIIHYDVRNATGFPWWWHTRKDDLSNISKTTLQAVGEVVMAQL